MCWDVVKRDLRFRKRIQMLSNSSGLLRYGPETVLTGLQRFLPSVWAFNLAGHSARWRTPAWKTKIKVFWAKKIPLARVGCVQKSRYVWAHRLKSETRLKAFRLLELKICRRMRAWKRMRLNDQVPVYLLSRNEAFGTSPKKGAWPS